MRVDHVATLDYTQFKLILVSMRIRVVAAMASSENEGECEPVNKPTLLKSYSQLVAVLLSLDVCCLFELVLENSGVVPAEEEVEFSQIKDPVEESEIRLLFLLQHHSFSEGGIADGLIDKAKEFAFAVELSLGVVEEVGEVPISAVDCFYQFALGEFCGEEAVLTEEDIVSVHEVVEVVADDRDSAVVQ